MKCSAAASRYVVRHPGTGPANWVISSVSASAARSDGVMPTRDVSHWRRRGRLWTDCPAHANLHGITIACQPINLGLTVRLTFVPSTADLRESCLMGTSATGIGRRRPWAARGVTGLLLIGGGQLLFRHRVAVRRRSGAGGADQLHDGNQPGVDPSLRRFGPLVPAAAFVLVGTTSLCVLTVLLAPMPACSPTSSSWLPRHRWSSGSRGSGRRSACW